MNKWPLTTQNNRRSPKPGERMCRGGFSLAEFAIALGVIGIILGGIWIFIAPASENIKRELAMEQIKTVVNSIRQTYTGQAGMPISNLQTTVRLLMVQEAIPISIKRQGVSTTPCAFGTATDCCANVKGVCADNPWGMRLSNTVFDNYGTFRVCGWNYGGSVWNAAAETACPTGAASAALTQFFAVNLTGLSTGSCAWLATNVSGPNGPPGLVDVGINGCNFIEGGGTCGTPGPTATFPVLAKDAVKLCGAAANANSISFIYRLMPQSL